MKVRTIAFGAAILTLLSCSGRQGVTVQAPAQGSTEVSTFTNPMPNTGVSDASHGRELYLAIGPLDGVNGALANGVALAHYFADKGTIVTLQLNIKPAEAGTFYEGWVEGDDGKRVLLGKLVSQTNDVQHSVRLDTPEDLSKMLNVTVSVQENGVGDTQGKVVASGTMKPIRR